MKKPNSSVVANLAARLCERREKTGISKYRLAILSGITKQTLTRLELGQGNPSWETVVKLARALGVGVEVFAVEDELVKAPKKGLGKK